MQAERIIEFGPSTVLTNMFRRTIDSEGDFLLSRSVKLQSYVNDSAEIAYHHEQDTSIPSDEPLEKSRRETKQIQPTKVEHIKQEAPRITNAVVHSSQSVDSEPPVQIADERVATLDIVRTLTAQKLKIASATLPVAATITGLAQGITPLQVF